MVSSSLAMAVKLHLLDGSNRSHFTLVVYGFATDLLLSVAEPPNSMVL